MARYINWKLYGPTDPRRIEANLFATLSPRVYPVNVIGSEVDDIFLMYAQELSSASVQVQGIYQDYDVMRARTVAVGSDALAPLYNNFGYALGISKFFQQDNTNFNTGSVLASYRSELRTLLRSYKAGASTEGLALTGQAFTGIAPIVIEPMKEYRGWKLASGSGHVAALVDGGIVPSQSIPRTSVGILPTTLAFNVNDPFYYSWSKLGTNTVVRSSNYMYSGVDMWLYGESTAIPLISASIENSINKVLRADLNPRYTWSSNFAYSRPDTFSSRTQPIASFIDDCLTGWNSPHISLSQEYTALYTGSIAGTVSAPYNNPVSYKVVVTYLSGEQEIFHQIATITGSSMWATTGTTPAGVKVVRVVSYITQTLFTNNLSVDSTYIHFDSGGDFGASSIGDWVVHPTSGEFRQIVAITSPTEALLDKHFTEEYWSSANVANFGTVVGRRVSSGTLYRIPPAMFVPNRDPDSLETYKTYTGDTESAAYALLACVDRRNTVLGDQLVSAISASVMTSDTYFTLSGSLADSVDAFSVQPMSGSIASTRAASLNMYALLQYYYSTQNQVALETATKMGTWLVSQQMLSGTTDYRAGLLLRSPGSSYADTEGNIFGFYALSLLGQTTGLPLYSTAARNIQVGAMSSLYSASVNRFVKSTTSNNRDYAEDVTLYSHGGNFLLQQGFVVPAKTLAARMISKFFIQDTSISSQFDLPNFFNQTYTYTSKPLHGFRQYAVTTDGETGDSYASPPSSSISQVGTLSALLFLDRLAIYNPEYDTSDYFDKLYRAQFSQDLIASSQGTGILAYTGDTRTSPFYSNVWPSLQASVWSQVSRRSPSLLFALSGYGRRSWEGSFLGYVQNSGIQTNNAFIGESIVLPTNYKTLDWYPDFFTLQANDGEIVKYICGYASASVPPTVPYVRVDSAPCAEPFLPTGSVGGLYLFDTLNGPMRNLTSSSNMLAVSVINATTAYAQARNTNRLALGITMSGGSTQAGWSSNTNSDFDLANGGTFSMWLYGLGSTAASASVIAYLKRSADSDNTQTLTANGYLFLVDSSTKTFSFSVKDNSGTQTVSASVRLLCEEDSSGWHNFVAVRTPSAAVLYVDGRFSNRLSMSVAPSALATALTTFVIGQLGTTTAAVAVDALSVYNTLASASDVNVRFEEEMPRFFRGAIPSGSVRPVYQPKVVLSGSGAGEVEYHQFSMRGLADVHGVVIDPATGGLLSIPIFKSGSL